MPVGDVLAPGYAGRSPIAGRSPLVWFFGDAAFARSGDGLDGEALGAAGGTAQALGEGGDVSVPAESVGHLRGGNPGRAPAGTVDIQQPAAAAVVGESVDVGECAHGESVLSARAPSASGFAQDCMEPRRAGDPSRSGARVSGRSLALRDGRGGRGFRGAFVLDRIKHFLAVHLDRFRRVDVRV